MKIQSPIFSGSITQASDAYAHLSGSFTGSFSGSFIGSLSVEQASFDNLTILNTLTLGSSTSDIQTIVGTINASGSVNVDGNVNVINGGQLQVDGVNVLDTALAYAIALG